MTNMKPKSASLRGAESSRKKSRVAPRNPGLPVFERVLPTPWRIARDVRLSASLRLVTSCSFTKTAAIIAATLDKPLTASDRPRLTVAWTPRMPGLESRLLMPEATSLTVLTRSGC